MGIDSQRLLQRVSADFHCSICLDLVDPIGALQAPCDHFWCRDCIDGAIASGQTRCPDDRTQALTYRTLRPLQEQLPLLHHMLLNVQVKCANHERGCSWQGDLSGAANHEASCNLKCQNCKKNKAQVAELMQRHRQWEKWRRYDATFLKVAYILAHYVWAVIILGSPLVMAVCLGKAKFAWSEGATIYSI